MIDISYALTLDGWMTKEELDYLAQMAQRSKSVAEIGSWRGRSTAALATNTTGTVWAVDTWDGSAEHQVELKALPKDALFSEFRENVSRFRNIRPVRKSSLSAARWFLSERRLFDLIFIDASHDYESVKADILAWQPLLRPGGVLCGHDYVWRTPHPFEGLKRAVDELVPCHRIVEGCTIWTTEGV